MNITLLSPYHGGSHRTWAEEYARNSRHSVSMRTLPARHWKWRMHGAAAFFARQVALQNPPDLFITTDMMDTALFSAMLPPSHRKPVLLFMHENQFDYPASPYDTDRRTREDMRYGFVNITSALTADTVVFNSYFHRASFLEHARRLLGAMPDAKITDEIDIIAAKSRVIYPGIAIPSDFKRTNKQPNRPPCFLWNHRHEYDKNPDLFFSALFYLKSSGIPFSVIIAGERGKTAPAVFNRARKQLKDEIIYDHFASTREEYHTLLTTADWMPVTSRQELFGISVLEAALFGISLLLPRRLTYPELFPKVLFNNYFYDSDNELLSLTKRAAEQQLPPSPEQFSHTAQLFDSTLWFAQLDDTVDRTIHQSRSGESGNGYSTGNI